MRKFIVCLTASLILSACGNGQTEVTVTETTVTQEAETIEESSVEETSSIEETTAAVVQETEVENDDIKYYQDFLHALVMDDYVGYKNGLDAVLDWEKVEEKYDDGEVAIDKWVSDYGAYLKDQDFDEDLLGDFGSEDLFSDVDEETIEEMKKTPLIAYFDYTIYILSEYPDEFKEEYPDLYTKATIMETYGYYSDENIEEMMTTLNQNALRASKQYLDKQIMIEGVLSAIDSSGKYITVTDGGQFSIVGCTCFIKNDEQLDKVAELNTGQKIYVLGTITQVGEALGYAMDIVDIYTEEDLNEP